jgi:fermentation-respiration switch protein FrsA (DUF1100 family)
MLGVIRGALRQIAMVIATALAVYVVVVAYLYLFQRSFLFEPSGVLETPVQAGLPRVEVMTITTADGTRLTAWYAAPEPGKPSVLYFHGNAASLSARADRFQQILDSGFGLLAAGYRGYPGSEGSPSEAALLSDGLELFDWLSTRAQNIVIHGESLGTGVAVYVAAEREARAVILEAPFTAALDIARATYPWVPVAFLMRDPFLSRERIASVSEPLLIVHGAKDSIVPVEHGRRLFEMASEPKEILVFEDADHADLWEAGLWPAALEFLQKRGVAPPQ